MRILSILGRAIPEESRKDLEVVAEEGLIKVFELLNKTLLFIWALVGGFCDLGIGLRIYCWNYYCCPDTLDLFWPLLEVPPDFLPPLELLRTFSMGIYC